MGQIQQLIAFGFVEGRFGVLGSHLGASEAIESAFFEGVYDLAHALATAPEVVCDLAGTLLLVGQAQDLGSAHGEALVRAQGFVESVELVLGEGLDKKRRFHGRHLRSVVKV